MYSTGQVSKMLGVSIVTLDRWIRTGVLKTTLTAGGQRRVEESEIQRYKSMVNSRVEEMAEKRRKQMAAAREQLYRNRVQVGFSQADLDSFNEFDNFNKPIDEEEVTKLKDLLSMENDDFECETECGGCGICIANKLNE